MSILVASFSTCVASPLCYCLPSDNYLVTLHPVVGFVCLYCEEGLYFFFILHSSIRLILYLKVKFIAILAESRYEFNLHYATTVLLLELLVFVKYSVPIASVRKFILLALRLDFFSVLWLIYLI